MWEGRGYQIFPTHYKNMTCNFNCGNFLKLLSANGKDDKIIKFPNCQETLTKVKLQLILLLLEMIKITYNFNYLYQKSPRYKRSMVYLEGLLSRLPSLTLPKSAGAAFFIHFKDLKLIQYLIKTICLFKKIWQISSFWRIRLI